MTRDTLVEVVGVGAAMEGEVEGLPSPPVRVGGAGEGEEDWVKPALPAPGLPLPLGEEVRVEPPPPPSPLEAGVEVDPPPPPSAAPAAGVGVPSPGLLGVESMEREGTRLALPPRLSLSVTLGEGVGARGVSVLPFSPATPPAVGVAPRGGGLGEDRVEGLERRVAVG